jgi:ABC-type phosphate transport system auxiliary subunit
MGNSGFISLLVVGILLTMSNRGIAYFLGAVLMAAFAIVVVLRFSARKVRREFK